MRHLCAVATHGPFDELMQRWPPISGAAGIISPELLVGMCIVCQSCAASQQSCMIYDICYWFLGRSAMRQANRADPEASDVPSLRL